jgi:hypothetical protein
MAKHTMLGSKVFPATVRALLVVVVMAGLVMTKPAPVHAASFQLTICHLPGGNLAKAQTITVSFASVPAHLTHGDWLAACEL